MFLSGAFNISHQNFRNSNNFVPQSFQLRYKKEEDKVVISAGSFKLTKILQKYGCGGCDNSVDHVNHPRPCAISTSWSFKTAMGLIEQGVLPYKC